MFDAAGLPHAARLERVPNSRRALVLGELAREAGRFGDVHPRIFDAYWREGRDIGSDEVLLDVAASAGMDPGEVAGRLGAPETVTAIEAETRAVVERGVTGVPAWVVDNALLIPGAQPHEVFERVLGGLGYQPQAG